MFHYVSSMTTPKDIYSFMKQSIETWRYNLGKYFIESDFLKNVKHTLTTWFRITNIIPNAKCAISVFVLQADALVITAVFVVGRITVKATEGSS